jgi:anti-sigma B factor antagonist
MLLRITHSPLKDDTGGDLTAVYFAGCRVALDEVAISRIRDQLLALADEPGESDVFLDLGNVEYLTSTALGTLVNLHKRLRARGRHMIVGNLSPQVHEVFTVTMLDRLLDLRLAGQGKDLPGNNPSQTGAVRVFRKPVVLTEVLDTPSRMMVRLPRPL